MFVNVVFEIYIILKLFHIGAITTPVLINEKQPLLRMNRQKMAQHNMQGCMLCMQLYNQLCLLVSIHLTCVHEDYTGQVSFVNVSQA